MFICLCYGYYLKGEQKIKLKFKKINENFEQLVKQENQR